MPSSAETILGALTLMNVRQTTAGAAEIRLATTLQGLRSADAILDTVALALEDVSLSMLVWQASMIATLLLFASQRLMVRMNASAAMDLSETAECAIRSIKSDTTDV
jgi:hypothetical protein